MQPDNLLELLGHGQIKMTTAAPLLCNRNNELDGAIRANVVPAQGTRDPDSLALAATLARENVLNGAVAGHRRCRTF